MMTCMFRGQSDSSDPFLCDWNIETTDLILYMESITAID